MTVSRDSFCAFDILEVGGQHYGFFNLKKAEENGLNNVSKLPFTLKIILENALRHEDGENVTKEHIESFVEWTQSRRSDKEINYYPTRVLLQDFTGVPALVDLAAMRDAVVRLGGSAQKVNPLIPVDLVVDHSLIVEYYGSPDAHEKNINIEYRRNEERYKFFKWAANSFSNLRIVPPGIGICHQVNIEYFSKTIWCEELSLSSPWREFGVEKILYPDTCIGADSHTTMANSLAVLSWGVGGIEAEAAMLGQPISMIIPEVVGFELFGHLKDGITATDLVLTITQMLRKEGVVEKFIEYYGEGLTCLALEDRATISNMVPEYGATCGFFPIDDETLKYLKNKGRSDEHVALVQAYAQAQGLFSNSTTPSFSKILQLDLGSVEPSLAGPKRPQDRVSLRDTREKFFQNFQQKDRLNEETIEKRFPVSGEDYTLGHGDIVIAAITSCTNTSNPQVLVAAGLLAQAARKRGLKVPPWVKTSLAPGSQIVTDYLTRSGLQEDLDALGFYLVGYGCTTCIGNSGPLNPSIVECIKSHNLVVASALSGNRNFEGRISLDVRANYLMSPPLVVAHAIAGSIVKDLAVEPLGIDANDHPVYLRDLWPSQKNITNIIREFVSPELFKRRYEKVFDGDMRWKNIQSTSGDIFSWDKSSTYIKKPPYFDSVTQESLEKSKEYDAKGFEKNIQDARILALFEDSITTDHISPAGSIGEKSPAGMYLKEHNVERDAFNAYGARRGNHEVMMRGTFANALLKNRMTPNINGGATKHYPNKEIDGEIVGIFEAARRYKAQKTPIIIIAGKEYGTGSSRDWAAKGPYLLGVQAVLAESFERIHRSNLIGMGIVPLQFRDGESWKDLDLTGAETVSVDLTSITPKLIVPVVFKMLDDVVEKIDMLCRVDTWQELFYIHQGGVLICALEHLMHK